MRQSPLEIFDPLIMALTELTGVCRERYVAAAGALTNPNDLK